MESESFQGIMDSSPLVAWIHNLSKNHFKYLKSKIAEFDLGHEVRYIMMIYDNPCISQDDLVIMSGQSKGNIAKSLKKLEDDGFIKREVNPENRRKYMLKTNSSPLEVVCNMYFLLFSGLTSLLMNPSSSNFFKDLAMFPLL